MLFDDVLVSPGEHRSVAPARPRPVGQAPEEAGGRGGEEEWKSGRVRNIFVAFSRGNWR